MLDLTITGLDIRTDLEALPKGGLEYGILYSATPGDHPRYPSYDEIMRICDYFVLHHNVTLALHICGSKALYQLIGGELYDLPGRFTRIQINGNIALSDLCSGLPRLGYYQEVITQITSVNDPKLLWRISDHSVLVDNSGGRGVLPDRWRRPRPTDKRVGFAGGLSPENLEEQLTTMLRDNELPDWIDMESGVRDSDDWLDVGRVRRVVDIWRQFNEQEENELGR